MSLTKQTKPRKRKAFDFGEDEPWEETYPQLKLLWKQADIAYKVDLKDTIWAIWISRGRYSLDELKEFVRAFTLLSEL